MIFVRIVISKPKDKILMRITQILFSDLGGVGNVVFSLIRQFELNEIVSKKGINLNSVKIFQKVIQLTETIEKESFGIELRKSLLTVFAEERIQIVQHYKRIDELVPSDYRLAVDVWNDSIN